MVVYYSIKKRFKKDRKQVKNAAYTEGCNESLPRFTHALFSVFAPSHKHSFLYQNEGKYLFENKVAIGDVDKSIFQGMKF